MKEEVKTLKEGEGGAVAILILQRLCNYSRYRYHPFILVRYFIL